jgi:hypothetical protein
MSDQAIQSCFSASYAEARVRFLAAAQDHGLAVTSYRNPAPGPEGVELATDVARLGPAKAERVMIVESGTHGIEGYAGSAIQLGLLTLPNAPRPAPDIALVLVHALNPYGFAWGRRVNEDNVDLNRSFVDHSRGQYPANQVYADLADAVVPRDWSEAGRAAAEAAFAAHSAKHGEQVTQSAYRRGQHTHPLGLYYGGRAPTWSAKTLAAICADQLTGAKSVGLIDIHTGLGPFGYGDCLTIYAPDSTEGRRASAWYGQVRHTMDVGTGYAGSQGTVIHGYTAAIPDLEWTCIGIEFGTRPANVMRTALRAEGWLHAHGGPDHPEAQRIRQALRDGYYPQEPEWKEMVLKRGLDVVKQGLAALAGH